MIRIENLTKTYGDHTVVDDLTFTAPAGLVTGFLGPNGAGKSTTLRILCGLADADSGTATIDGVGFRQLPTPGRKVGVMLSANALHSARTGQETLRLAALADGLPRDVIAPMLARVGIADAARKRVGAYSLGMRQRLGLAVALLGEPDVLILDEPANGLDPEGIRWMRELLDDFAADGGTVLLSSHFLGEVQHVADRIVVIHKGRLITSGPTTELLASGEAQVVAATDGAALRSVLTEEGLEWIDLDGSDGVQVAAVADRIGDIALRHGLVLTRLEGVSSDLETRFLELTQAA